MYINTFRFVNTSNPGARRPPDPGPIRNFRNFTKSAGASGSGNISGTDPAGAPLAINARSPAVIRPAVYI